MVNELKKLREKKELKITDRVILSLIRESGIDGFTMTDHEIMELLNITKSPLHNSLNKLKALGLIYSVDEGVRRRIFLLEKVNNGRKSK